MIAPLPARDGVSPSAVWLPDGAWRTMLEFLVDRFTDIAAATWIARMQKGLVVDENGTPIDCNTPYRSGLRLYYYRELDTEASIPFTETILYQDDHIVVVDKPHFLPVIPSGRFLHETLLVRLKRKLRLDYLAPIHRIDRETAGLVLFCITPNSRGHYQSLFQRREVTKTYHALARLRPDLSFPRVHRSRMVEGQPFFRMQETAGEPNSETHIELIEARGELALYQLTPVTGRKHQLRVHMASLAIPIMNDAFYPQLLTRDQDDFSRPLQLLAKAIAFTDPLTGAARQFASQQALSLQDASAVGKSPMA
ncbi:MAG: RluA family pseudouridine synthase [Gammaproteobacteria bacterium]|nr:RluA family pseudouridine synthase [Gammaproteobacteria bacterium]